MTMVITVTVIIVTIKMCKYLEIEESHESINIRKESRETE